MASIIDLLSNALKDALEGYPTESLDPKAMRVSPATNAKFGDYQFNAAMALAKKVGRPPRDLAGEIVERIAGEPFLEKAEVAGPGFVNLWVSPAWLSEQVSRVRGEAHLGVEPLGAGQTVVIDYSSPNVAKQMHIGHIRSTMLGHALDKIYRHLGFNVIADNHIGDWGTQFGILLSSYRRIGDPEAFERDPIEELERVYVEGARYTQENPSARDEAKEELVRLQQGDPENRALWERFVRASLKEFDKTYEKLGVSFDVTHGESFYNDRLPGVVEDLKGRGLAVENEGAMVVFLEEEGLSPFLVQKSDGGFNYATSDIAAVGYRVETWDPVKIVYVTDERQQLHFKQLFAVARRLGFQVGLEHIWFGVMRLPEGTFSTRDGNVIKLERLLEEAVDKAYEVAHRLNPSLDEATKREVARKVGIGAVKYSDLSQNRQSTVMFTWEKALSLEGNSAPYIQYAYARIQSVFRKFREEFPDSDLGRTEVALTEDLEMQIAKKVLEFPEYLGRAAWAYRPNLLTDYLYELVALYSRFYQNLPFLKAPDGVRETRLVLCEIVSRVIETSLGLLGIEVPDRM